MTGRLLVATPALRSPEFDRTVVLMLEHGDHGALGVVLNRPSQLEDEIEEGAWFVLTAEPEDALSNEPDGLWRTVLKRQGGEYALVSTFPPDPTMN